MQTVIWLSNQPILRSMTISEVSATARPREDPQGHTYKGRSLRDEVSWISGHLTGWILIRRFIRAYCQRQSADPQPKLKAHSGTKARNKSCPQSTHQWTLKMIATSLVQKSWRGSADIRTRSVESSNNNKTALNWWCKGPRTLHRCKALRS